MLYKTHKAAGVLACLVSFDVMRNTGQLAPGINEFIQLAIIYPACSWASTAPDLDHALCNVKEQTPINVFLNKILHIGGFCALLFGLLARLGVYNLGFDENSISILRLMILGINFGVASHLIMDCLTTAGIWLVPKVKFRLVPNTTIFKTGGRWEDIIRVLVYIFIIYMSIHLIVRWCGFSLVIGTVPIL